MRAIIALVVVSVSALVVEAGPLKRLRERRDDRTSRVEVVVDKDGAKKVTVRGGSEAVVTKDRVEIRQAAPRKGN